MFTARGKEWITKYGCKYPKCEKVQIKNEKERNVVVERKINTRKEIMDKDEKTVIAMARSIGVAKKLGFFHKMVVVALSCF